MPTFTDIIALLGVLIRLIGFLLAGYALTRLVLDMLKAAAWQLQAILVLGLFGLLIGVIVFSAPGGAGAFALGMAGAYLMPMLSKKDGGASK